MSTPHLSRRTLLTLTSVTLLAGLAACAEEPRDYKPVLYIYPDRACELEVGLDYAGELTYTYPEPERSGRRAVWRVTASPDGTLTDATGRTYPYLFWEGINPALMVQKEGFVVEAGQVSGFLEDKLALLGLSEREAAEFITFWAPRVEATPRALLTFAAEQHEAIATYTFTQDGAPVSPEVFIRVYLVIGDVPADPVPEQDLAPAPSRHGFTAVEWGGCDQRTTDT